MLHWGSFQIEFIYFLIGLLASTFGALAGIGGGVIIKPLLDFVGHYDVITIGVLSAATVFSMATVSLIKAPHESVKIEKISVYLALGSMIGGILGKLIFNYIINVMNNLDTVSIIQASTFASLIVFILLYFRNKELMRTYQINNIFAIFIVGLFLGLIAAFLGIGGGPFNVAILALGFSMNAKESAINSIFIIFFSQLAALLFTASTVGFSSLDLSMLPFMICGGLLGGFLGSALLQKLGDQTIANFFYFGLSIILFLNLYNIFSYIFGWFS